MESEPTAVIRRFESETEMRLFKRDNPALLTTGVHFDTVDALTVGYAVLLNDTFFTKDAIVTGFATVQSYVERAVVNDARNASSSIRLLRSPLIYNGQNGVFVNTLTVKNSQSLGIF
jgi:hypothetical protein